VSYKKIGGIHFVKLGRFGFNFYVSRSDKARVNAAFKAVERAILQPEPAGVRSRIVPNGGRVFN
jgi:hypothetical protein